MTLAEELKYFIEEFIISAEITQGCCGYESLLERVVDKLYSLCTTENERAIVKAIVSLEEH